MSVPLGAPFETAIWAAVWPFPYCFDASGLAAEDGTFGPTEVHVTEPELPPVMQFVLLPVVLAGLTPGVAVAAFASCFAWPFDETDVWLDAVGVECPGAFAELPCADAEADVDVDVDAVTVASAEADAVVSVLAAWPGGVVGAFPFPFALPLPFPLPLPAKAVPVKTASASVKAKKPPSHEIVFLISVSSGFGTRPWLGLRLKRRIAPPGYGL